MLLDDIDLSIIDWKKMDEKEIMYRYNDYIGPAQEEEDIIYTMNGQREGKEFAIFQRDEL